MNEEAYFYTAEVIPEDVTFEDRAEEEVTVDAAMDAVMESPEYEAMLHREYDRRIGLLEEAIGNEDATDSILDYFFVLEALWEAASDTVMNTEEFSDLLSRTEDAIRRKRHASQADTEATETAEPAMAEPETHSPH